MITTLLTAPSSGLAGLIVAIPLAASLAFATTAHAQSGGATQGSAGLGPREVLLGTSKTPRNLNVFTTDREPLPTPPQPQFRSSLGAPVPTGDVWRTVTLPGTSPAAATTGPTKRPTRTAQDTFRQTAGDLVFFSGGRGHQVQRCRR